MAFQNHFSILYIYSADGWFDVLRHMAKQTGTTGDGEKGTVKKLSH